MTKHNLSRLAQAGYITLPYPKMLRAGVRASMKAWRDFCALPLIQKKRITYSGDLNVSGVGYELKLDDGANNDLKEDFHLRISQKKFLLQEAAKVGPAAIEFVGAALYLNHLAGALALEFARMAEKEFGIAGLAEDTRAKQPEALIRFLHYFGGRKVGDELASQHVDKGGFTLHLCESDPGLQFLDYERHWRPMNFSTAETAIIPGMRLQLRSDNKLKATCHRVLANEKTAKRGRFSAVIFQDFAKTPYYDKARLGRLQDYPAGFNYTMPLAEFQKLFKAA